MDANRRRPARSLSILMTVALAAAAALASPAQAQAQEQDDPVRELITALRELREEVRDLRREVADLRREIEEVRHQGAGFARPPEGRDDTSPGPVVPPPMLGGEPRGQTPGAPGAGAAAAPGTGSPKPLPIPATSPPYIVEAPDDGAVVRGRVRFSGTVGEPQTIAITRNADLFGPAITAEDLLVGANGGLENAIVWLDSMRRGKPHDLPAPAIEARGPRFLPRVQVATPRTTIRLVNGNEVSHVFRVPGLFNLIVPGASEAKHLLGEPGLVRIVDEIHPWIVAYVFVAPNPYATTTAADGSFEIAGIPPGKHRLRVWHEALGETVREVEVTAGGLTEVEVTLGQP